MVAITALAVSFLLAIYLVTGPLRPMAAISGPQVYVGNANFSNSELSLVTAFMNQNLSSTSKDALDMEYDALFAPSNIVDMHPFHFEFQFRRNSNMNSDMFAAYPQTNSTFLLYNVNVSVGVQGSFMFFGVAIEDLYGSPYGNSSNRGGNQLTLYVHVGKFTYGLGEYSTMLPGSFGQDDYARYTNGTVEKSSHGGYQIYGYTNSVLPNQTYYLGPVNFEDPYGNSSYNAATTFPAKGVFWAASEILGSASNPAFTSYLFVLNTSAVFGSSLASPAKILFSLQTSNPFPVPIGNTGLNNFMALVDNFPTHSMSAPLSLTSYARLQWSP